LVHDVVHRPSWLRILRWTKPAISLAIAPSDAAAEPLRRLDVDVRVVRNGTPWPVAVMRSRRRDPFVVGCAGMLTSWKGQDVLLDAVARIRRPDVVVELAGGQFPKDGPYVARLHRRAAEPDLCGRVTFLGAVDDLPDRMRTWTMMVSSSVDPEANALVALEAMSVGLPVVGTDHGGTREVLGDAGLLVPRADPDGMARAIERLLDDEQLWQRCHESGPRQVAAGMTLDDQMRTLLAELDGLLARPT
jgi:glycosyltransferase involved in cell wall biosynthesis